MERNNIIDSFRALAITLVTGFHVFGWALVCSGVDWYSMSTPLHFLWFDASALVGNGWVGVGMFFVISGYCMAKSSERYFSGGVKWPIYSKYVLNRFLRIALPYYSSIILWVILIRFFGFAPKPTGFWDIASHILFVHNLSSGTIFSISGVYWTIAVEMQFYIILPVIISFFRSTKNQMLIVVFSLLLTITINTLSSSVVLTWSIVSYLYLFLLGWVLSLHQIKWRKFFDKESVFYLSLISFITLLLYKGNGFDNKFKMYEILTSSVFGIFMLSSAYKINGRSAFILFTAYVGRCSFSIYLYNYIFWLMAPGNHSVRSIISAYCIVLSFGILMHYVIERNTEKIRKRVMKSAFITKQY